MPFDRLSVTVPSKIGAALRALAEARGATVSTVVTEAIAHQVRLAALDEALAEADRRFGVLDADLMARAEADLVKAARLPRARSRRRAGG